MPNANENIWIFTNYYFDTIVVDDNTEQQPTIKLKHLTMDYNFYVNYCLC